MRRAGVAAIEDLATLDRGAAIKLYKPLVSDADPAVRAKASGQLARLVPSRPHAARSAQPPPDDTLPRVQTAFDQATATAAEAQKVAEAFDALAQELAATVAAHTHDDATLAHVAALKKQLDEAPARLDASAANVEAAAKAAAAAAGASSSPGATKLVADARVLAHTARAASTAARTRAAAAVTAAAGYLKDETSDVQILIASAEAATLTGDFPTAKANLDRAAKRLRDAGARTTRLDDPYAQLYDKMAEHTRDPTGKRKLLLQAQAAYQRFARTGAGPRVQRAKDRLTEIADELKELGPP